MRGTDTVNIGSFSRMMLVSAGIALIFTGCGPDKTGKKEDKAANEAAAPAASVPPPAPTSGGALSSAIPQGGAMPEGHPQLDKTDATMPGVMHSGLKGQKEVRLSDEVKAKWKEVTLNITDASTKKTVSMTLTVGSTTPVGSDGSKLKIDAFVPDYSISGDHIESRSNEPKNPAVLVTLYKGDKAVAKGWVFKKLPDFNSYNNDRFHIALESPGIDSKK